MTPTFHKRDIGEHSTIDARPKPDSLGPNHSIMNRLAQRAQNFRKVHALESDAYNPLDGINVTDIRGNSRPLMEADNAKVTNTRRL